MKIKMVIIFLSFFLLISSCINREVKVENKEKYEELSELVYKLNQGNIKVNSRNYIHTLYMSANRLKFANGNDKVEYNFKEKQVKSYNDTIIVDIKLEKVYNYN